MPTLGFEFHTAYVHTAVVARFEFRRARHAPVVRVYNRSKFGARRGVGSMEAFPPRLGSNVGQARGDGAARVYFLQHGGLVDMDDQHHYLREVIQQEQCSDGQIS